MKRPLVEICVDSADAAVTSEQSGADRIELCSSVKFLGGVTPSLGVVRATLKAVNIPVMIIVRPRGGDFLYSDLEFESMVHDVGFIKREGANGIVVGILTADGNIDIERTKRLIDAARPMQVTFHRAFDMTADAEKALDDLIQLGVDRVLTSGQRKSALDGVDLLAILQKQAKGRIVIMPGCGINQLTIAEIICKVQPSEVHLSALKTVSGKMVYRNAQASMSADSSNDQEYSVDVADREKISGVIKVLETLC